MSEQVEEHDWWVYSTALADRVILVVCRKTGALGAVDNPTPEEWKRAFHAPSKSYQWTEANRVRLSERVSLTGGVIYKEIKIPDELKNVEFRVLDKEKDMTQRVDVESEPDQWIGASGRMIKDSEEKEILENTYELLDYFVEQWMRRAPRPCPVDPAETLKQLKMLLYEKYQLVFPEED